jgi:hypothetical protein
VVPASLARRRKHVALASQDFDLLVVGAHHDAVARHVDCKKAHKSSVVSGPDVSASCQQLASKPVQPSRVLSLDLGTRKLPSLKGGQRRPDLNPGVRRAGLNEFTNRLPKAGGDAASSPVASESRHDDA